MDAGGWTTIVVRIDDLELVVARLDGRRPDLALVEALARLALVLRRLGCELELRDPGRELSRLVDLVGLAGVVAGPPASALALEPGREAEGGEQRRVEEVVDPGDPAV